MKNCGITDDAPAKKDAIHMQYIFGETAIESNAHAEIM